MISYAGPLEAKAKDPERGSVTIEQVAWAAAVIAIVAIAVGDPGLRHHPGRSPLTAEMSGCGAARGRSAGPRR
jgi:hypothetical protein